MQLLRNQPDRGARGPIVVADVMAIGVDGTPGRVDAALRVFVAVAAGIIATPVSRRLPPT